MSRQWDRRSYTEALGIPYWWSKNEALPSSAVSLLQNVAPTTPESPQPQAVTQVNDKRLTLFCDSDALVSDLQVLFQFWQLPVVIERGPLPALTQMSRGAGRTRGIVWIIVDDDDLDLTIRIDSLRASSWVLNDQRIYFSYGPKKMADYPHLKYSLMSDCFYLYKLLVNEDATV